MSEDNVERVPHQEPKTTEVSERQQQDVETEAGRHTGRRWAVALLIVLGCILLAGANGAFWLKGTVLSTNRWVAAVGPLSRNEAIANTVSVYVVGDLFEAVDVASMVEEALPEEVKVLSGPLTKGLQELFGDVTTTVIQSDQFNVVWVAGNRAAHTVVIGALRGGGSHLYLKEGQLTIDLSSALDFVEGSLDLPALLGLSPDKDWGKFVLLQSDQVARVQQALGLLDTLGWLFPLATLVAFVAAWLVSLWRRRTLLWIGVGGGHNHGPVADYALAGQTAGSGFHRRPSPTDRGRPGLGHRTPRFRHPDGPVARRRSAHRRRGMAGRSPPVGGGHPHGGRRAGGQLEEGIRPVLCRTNRRPPLKR